MKAEKRSSFLKGLKRRNKSPRHVKLVPNSTKVGAGDGYINRPFDVDKKRAEQERGSAPNGVRSRWAASIIERDEKRRKKLSKELSKKKDVV